MNVNQKIFELFDDIEASFSKEDKYLIKELKRVDKEWDKLPMEKMDDTDRTLLAMVMMDVALKMKEFQVAKKWTGIYLHNERHREMVDLYEGQLAFYEGKYAIAYKKFKNAQELSSGKVLKERPEFLDLIKQPAKYGL